MVGLTFGRLYEGDLYGNSKKFSEIIGASTLAGEVAICARITNGTFVEGHRKYGRKHIQQDDQILLPIGSNGFDESTKK